MRGCWGIGIRISSTPSERLNALLIDLLGASKHPSFEELVHGLIMHAFHLPRPLLFLRVESVPSATHPAYSPAYPPAYPSVSSTSEYLSALLFWPF
jgi:hypothetical protein